MDLILGTFFSAVITSITFLVTYYYLIVVKKPKVHVNNPEISNFLQKHVKILNNYYWPTFFYWEGRLQTILSIRKRIPNSIKLPYRREIFKLNDGGELALDFLESANQGANNNNNNNNDGNGNTENNFVVFLLPGLTSSSQTCYIKTLVMAITKIRGADVVIMNYRGIGGHPLTTPRTHNACNCDDIHEIVMYLKKIYPNKRLMGIGTSLGGILLCRYLITYPVEARNIFTAAFVISTVWDMWAATENLEKPIINKYILNHGICQDVVYRVRKSEKVLEKRDCWNLEHVYKSKSGREFDTRFHVPQFGYNSLEEYYNDCVVSNHTHKFPIPVFALNSYDDPMMPGKKLPVKEIYTTNPKSNLALIVTSYGGHLGFLEGFSTKPKPFHFVERLTEQIVNAIKLYGDELMQCKR